jgi:hypothetical protein
LNRDEEKYHRLFIYITVSQFALPDGSLCITRTLSRFLPANVSFFCFHLVCSIQCRVHTLASLTLIHSRPTVFEFKDLDKTQWERGHETCSSDRVQNWVNCD